MANKLTPETMALLQSKNPYDWMTFIREYCATYGYKMRWNCALSKQIYSQLRNIISKKFLSGQQLYKALNYHCKSSQYLRILVRKSNRYNVQGNPDGRVTAEEGNYAWMELCKHHPDVAKQVRASHKKRKQVVRSRPNQNVVTDKPKRNLTFRPRTKKD